jgi:hypothetical protein
MERTGTSRSCIRRPLIKRCSGSWSLAAADFAVADLGLVIEPSALAVARRSLEEPGFLLLGEVHGVRENPLVIRALMRAFGLSGLAWNGLRAWRR